MTLRFFVRFSRHQTWSTPTILASAAEPKVTTRHHDSLDAALAQDQTLPVIVPITMPLQHLCMMMADGAAIDVAIAQWCDHAEAVLKACRKHRRRVVLIDAGILENTPAALTDALATRLGLRFGAISPPASSARPEFADLHTAIAAAALVGDEKATDLADELEAMMLGPVFARNLSGDVALSAVQKLANLAEERDLLRENVRLHLESTEELLAEKAKFADRPLLKAQCEALARQLDEAREGQREREAALGAEILRLAAQMRDERHRLGAELQHARDEIGGLIASTSWKLTRPIRVVKRGLQRG